VESLIYPAFLNAKAPLDEQGFFMAVGPDFLAGRCPVRPATGIVIPAPSSSCQMQA